MRRVLLRGISTDLGTPSRDQHPPIVIYWLSAHSSILSVGSSPDTFLGKLKPAGSYWWHTEVALTNVSQKPVKIVRLEWILYDATRSVMRTETVDYQRFTHVNISRPQLPVSPLGAGETSAILVEERPVSEASFALGHYALVLVLNAWFTDGTTWAYKFPK